jgi:hypothetical protein
VNGWDSSRWCRGAAALVWKRGSGHDVTMMMGGGGGRGRSCVVYCRWRGRRFDLFICLVGDDFIVFMDVHANDINRTNHR